LVKVRIQLKAE